MLPHPRHLVSLLVLLFVLAFARSASAEEDTTEEPSHEQAAEPSHEQAAEPSHEQAAEPSHEQAAAEEHGEDHAAAGAAAHEPATAEFDADGDGHVEPGEAAL